MDHAGFGIWRDRRPESINPRRYRTSRSGSAYALSQAIERGTSRGKRFSPAKIRVGTDLVRDPGLYRSALADESRILRVSFNNHVEVGDRTIRSTSGSGYCSGASSRWHRRGLEAPARADRGLNGELFYLAYFPGSATIWRMVRLSCALIPSKVA